jgi:hypothetical protein
MVDDILWKEQETTEIKKEEKGKAEFAETYGKKLDTFIQQNSPVNNELIRNDDMNDILHTDIDGQLSIIPTEVISRTGKNKTKQVVTMCSFSYGEDVDEGIFEIRGANKITAYDRRVYNAVSTLYYHGRRTVTLNEIYSVMTGYERNNPAKSQLESIEKCLKKLSSVNVFIDLTEEVNSRIIENKQPLIDAGILKSRSDKIKKATIEDKMIHITVGTLVSENGKTFKSIKINGEPSLLTYNRAKNTLITVPMKFIGLSNSNATEKTIAFQDYLLIRILGYKNGKMRENKILYDTMYKNSGVEKPSVRKDLIRDRETVRKIMEEWVQVGLISSYEEFKKGKSYIGISFKIKDDDETE